MGNCWCLLLGGFWVCFAYDFAVVLGDVWFWFVLILIGLVGFGVWLWLFFGLCSVVCCSGWLCFGVWVWWLSVNSVGQVVSFVFLFCLC